MISQPGIQVVRLAPKIALALQRNAALSTAGAAMCPPTINSKPVQGEHKHTGRRRQKRERHWPYPLCLSPSSQKVRRKH